MFVCHASCTRASLATNALFDAGLYCSLCSATVFAFVFSSKALTAIADAGDVGLPVRSSLLKTSVWRLTLYGMACGGGADAGSVVFTIFPSLMQASMQCGGSFLLVLVSQMMLTLTFPSDRRKQTLKPVSFTRIVFWRTIDPGGTAGDGCGVGLAGASGSGFGASGADAGTGGAGFGLAVSVSTAGAEGSCKSRGAQVTFKGFGLYLLGFGISMLRKSMQYQSCPVTVALPGDTVVD